MADVIKGNKDGTDYLLVTEGFSGDVVGSTTDIEVDYTLLLEKRNEDFLAFKQEHHADLMALKSSIHDDSVVAHQKLDTIIEKYQGMIDEAKIANNFFSQMVVQLTRIADCTCWGCPDASYSLCEVTEDVLRQDGLIP